MSIAPAAAQSPPPVTAQVYGAGALPAGPFWRQAADCYGFNLDLVEYKPPLPGESYPIPDCGVAPVNPTQAVHYLANSSTLGLRGFYAHDPALWGDIDPATANDQYYPFAHYAVSQRVLDRARVDVCDFGGLFVGLDVAPPLVAPAPGQTPNPRQRYGPLAQFPVGVEPITIAFDPVYKKIRNARGGVDEYRLNLRYPRADGSGGLRLDRPTYCAIFNGLIVNWNHPTLTALNGGVRLRDPADPVPAVAWSAPMQIVGHANASGTTAGFTRHLARACGDDRNQFYFTGEETLPAPLMGVFYDKTLANDPVPGEALGR